MIKTLIVALLLLTTGAASAGEAPPVPPGFVSPEDFSQVVWLTGIEQDRSGGYVTGVVKAGGHGLRNVMIQMTCQLDGRPIGVGSDSVARIERSTWWGFILPIQMGARPLEISSTDLSRVMCHTQMSFEHNGKIVSPR